MIEVIIYIVTRKIRLNYLGCQLKIYEIEGFQSNEHSFEGLYYRERGGWKGQGTPLFGYVNEFKIVL
jgi:hypothetical protein